MGQYYRPVLSRSQDRDGFAGGVFASMTSWDHGEGAKLLEHSYVGNVLPETVVGVLADGPARVVWAGDYADPEPGGDVLLYSVGGTARSLPADPRPHRFLVDLDRGEYIDMERVADVDGEPGWKIHPLPLLTSEGNGRGGGDFRGDSPFLGRWARDLLAATDTRPAGLAEVVPGFVEV